MMDTIWANKNIVYEEIKMLSVTQKFVPDINLSIKNECDPLTISWLKNCLREEKNVQIDDVSLILFDYEGVDKTYVRFRGVNPLLNQLSSFIVHRKDGHIVLE